MGPNVGTSGPDDHASNAYDKPKTIAALVNKAITGMGESAT